MLALSLKSQRERERWDGGEWSGLPLETDLI